MPRIGVQLIYGANPEPFLEAALRSVAWADYVCAVNTAPDDPVGEENERTVRGVVPAENLRHMHLRFEDGFDFAAARNHALHLADEGDWVLLLDADMVHYPEFEHEARELVAAGHDMISALFYHLCVYRDMVHSIQDREILFRYDAGLRFVGEVHETPDHQRRDPTMATTRFVHYGYVKPAREVAGRWELYRTLGAEVHEYAVEEPDRALDEWPAICERQLLDHPPAARDIIESYPPAPPGVGRCRVGLVLLTWDDAANLRDCLATLAETLEPFELCVVDNGSTDESGDLFLRFQAQTEHRIPVAFYQALGAAEDPRFGCSLAQALNVGFGHFLDREDIDYVGWIHPDHIFTNPDWLTRLRVEMDTSPQYAKLGAQEIDDPTTGLRPGNSQCYLIRRTALTTVGLFNEGFQRCGGYEDWEHNFRLLRVGQVMITPSAVVRHKAMQTRQRHDNLEAGHQNADLYYRLTGTRDPVV